MHYDYTDIHKDLTQDTELYSRAVGNKTKQFCKLISYRIPFLQRPDLSLEIHKVSSYSITAK